MPDVPLTDLGQHRLKDFGEPRRLYALGTGAQPPPRTLDPLRTNLPSVRGPLIGRDQELEQVIGRLLGDSRLITLTGAGGNGKTRLALEKGNSQPVPHSLEIAPVIRGNHLPHHFYILLRHRQGSISAGVASCRWARSYRWSPPKLTRSRGQPPRR